ncbi:MAG: alpha-amylase family glycosyl hydrolase [Pseudomonadota bacterium]
MTADPEWWRGAVLYQIYPRSFCDSNNDGIGDLPGITRRLDYIARLGVDGFWISPFFTSPMTDFGYDVADYCNVDPMFGTLDDFDELVERAHALGLKVVIDQVYSHTSDQHAWFEESRSSRDNPKADWYVWADAKTDGSPPNNWQSVFTGPSWTWDGRRGQYYLHNFLTSQPDLNLHNAEVQDALLSVARFWLDRGVDGFRLDAINCGMHDPALRDNPPSTGAYRSESRPYYMQHQKYNMCHDDLPAVLERLRVVTNAYGDILTVAEVGSPEPLPLMKEYTLGARRLNTAYGFDFLVADEVSPDLVRRVLEGWPGVRDEGWPSWAFSNHDAPRVVSRWLQDAPHAQRARLIAMLLISLRGNLFIYQGEELGLTQGRVPFERLQDPEAIRNWPATMGRDGARTPMPWTSSEHGGFSTVEPWLPVDADHLPLSVQRQEEDDASILHFFRRLLEFRRQHAVLRLGEQRFLDAPEGVLHVERRLGEQTLTGLFNLTSSTVNGLPALKQRFRDSLRVGEIGDSLPAYGALIGLQS